MNTLLVRRLSRHFLSPCWMPPLLAPGVVIAVVVFVSVTILTAAPPSEGGPGANSKAPSPGRVRVASLVYDGGKTTVCFSPDFLAMVARNTNVNVQRTFDTVHAASDKLYNYPFIIMSGTGRFKLSRAERTHLKQYIERGGFLLASSSCSNAAWIDSFNSAMTHMFGDNTFKSLQLKHPIFHTLYDIDAIRLTKTSGTPALYGLTLHKRLHVVFSPMGLNDTADAGKGCCCCGGNEVRNARLINANMLVYALTH